MPCIPDKPARSRARRLTLPLLALLTLPVTALPQTAPNPQRAAGCVVDPFTAREGATTIVYMRLQNDGGFCPVAVAFADAGNMWDLSTAEEPAHGKVFNGKTPHKVAYSAYIPAPGFTGKDQFTVRSSPDGSRLVVYATVNPKGN